jgi:hypothetical protein
MDKIAPATFSLAPGIASIPGHVVRRGKMFELGTYSDKGFVLDELEADRILAAFNYAPNELEHLWVQGIKTIFDGKLGGATEMYRQGNEIHGSMLIPTWLNDAIGPDEELPVSLTFHPETKEILTVGLVVEGRIPDAKVLATAFSAANPGTAPTAATESRTESRPPMKLLDAFRDLISRTNDAGEVSDTAPVTQPVTVFAPDPVQKQENDQLKQILAAREGSAIEDVAIAFHRDMVRAGKADPAEKDAMIASFAQAIKDDNAGKPTCFSSDGKLTEGSRTKNFRDIYAARSVNPLLKAVADGVTANATAFSNSATVAGMTPERRAELLSATSMGRDMISGGK